MLSSKSLVIVSSRNSLNRSHSLKKDHTPSNRFQNYESIKVNETYARTKLRGFSVLNVGFFKMNTSITILMQSFSQMNSSKYLYRL